MAELDHVFGRDHEMHAQELELVSLAWGDWAGLTPEEVVGRLDDGPLLRFMAQMRYEQINAAVVAGALIRRDDLDDHARESEWNVRSDPSS